MQYKYLLSMLTSSIIDCKQQQYLYKRHQVDDDGIVVDDVTPQTTTITGQGERKK